MAFCPECSAEISATAVECDSCGFRFPKTADTRSKSRPEGLAYSGLADIALVVSMIAAAFGCVGAVIAGISSVLRGEFLSGLVVAPIAFFLQLGMLVVFIRVQDR